MKTKTFFLNEYINHCIRDYKADFAFIKEGVAALHHQKGSSAEWDMAELTRVYDHLQETLLQLNKDLDE